MSVKMKTYNNQTERKVLNLLLNNENAIEIALSMGLNEENFSTERHRIILEKIIDVYVEQTIAVGDDLDIIIDKIEYDDNDDKKETILTLDKLQKLKLSSGKNISAKYLPTYIKELQDLTIVRKIIKCTQNITKCLNDETSTSEDLLMAVEKFDSAINVNENITRMDMNEATKTTIQEIVEEAEYDNNVKFYLSDLDMDAKILKGYLTYIAGAPGIGKSAVTINMASNMSDANVKILYVSLEMNIPDCVKRMISMRENIYSQRMINPKLLKSSDWKILERVLDDGIVKTDNIYWIYKPDLTIPELKSEIIRNVKMHDIDVVLIDYYQLLRLDKDSTLSESVEIPRVSNSLKTLAGMQYINPYGKMKKIYMVALSQVVKEVEKRENKRPFMNDLYYGGAKDARLVIGLYRDEYYNPDTTTKPNIIEFGIIKQNNGIMNEWYDSYFDGNTFNIRDLTEDEKTIVDDAQNEREYNNSNDSDDYEEED